MEASLARGAAERQRAVAPTGDTGGRATLVHYNFNFICHFEGFGTYFFFTDGSIQQGDGQFCQENLSTGQFSCPTFIASRVTCPTTKNFLF